MIKGGLYAPAHAMVRIGSKTPRSEAYNKICRRGDVKANQLDDDQTNRVILSSSSADVKAPISIRSVTAESTACGRGASTARFKNEAHVGDGAPLL